MMCRNFAICCFTLILPAALASGQTYTFTKIVDSSDGVFNPFAFSLPSLNDAGEVAFKAENRTTLVAGIFRGSGGPLTTIADTTGSINFLGNSPSINNSGEMSFAALFTGGSAVFRGSGGPLTTIASSAGPFRAFSFNNFMNNSGVVAWQAELDDFDEGLFTGDGGPITTVFLNSTSKFNDSFSSPSINDAAQIAFEAGRDVGDRGIFRFEPGTGLFTTIVTNSGSLSRISDDPGINASGKVVLHSQLFGSTEEGIFVGDGTTITPVADTLGPYSFFNPPTINDAGQVAFTAALDSGFKGLFDGPDPEDNLVLRSGVMFDGGLLTSMFMGREGLNNNGELAFLAQFAGGRAAIYRATIPEPAAALLALGGTVLLAARRARF